MTRDIATLMVVVDGEHPGDEQLKDVGAFAAELGAGVLAVTASDYALSFYFVAGAVAANVLEEDTRRLQERMTAAEKRCREALARSGMSFEWRSAVGIPMDFVARQARAADLILCFSRGKPAPFSDADPGELVLRSGRPVLVVPPSAGWRSPGKILVAWKDTREARRAIYDSLPILRRAKAVRVLEIVEGEESPKRAEGRVRDIVAWLKAHEVAASKLVMTPPRDTSEALATVAEDFDADWIVAGAYGHTRVGEWIFGGVTRHLLMESRRPAFLSH